MKGERKKGGQWPVSRMTTGSGLPRTVPALTLESHILACPSKPGQTGHPEWGYWERPKRVFWGSQGKKSISSQSPRVGSACPRAASYSSTAWSHCPGPALPCPNPMGVQCKEPLGEPVLPCGWARNCQSRSRPGCVWRPPASREWLSIAIHLLWAEVFLPCQSCICMPITRCSGPAYPSSWLVFPPSIFLLPLLSTLVWNSADFFQHSGWELQQLGWLITVASSFRGGAGSTCSPQTAESSAFLLLSLQPEDGCTEELEGEGRQLF